VVTAIGVIATDLLVGVAIGIVVEMIIHLIHGVTFNNLFKMHFDINEKNADVVYVNIEGAAVFSNLMALKEAVGVLEKGKNIVFQLNDAYLLDHSMMGFLHDFQHDYEAMGGHCEFSGLEYHEPFSEHPLAARRMKPNYS
jgi:MFS superfamily sulfate permease-like transporter